MSVRSEKKVPKLSLSLKKVVNTKKNGEKFYSNSDYDTTSTGSNESEISATPSNRSSIEKHDTSIKVSKTSKALTKKLRRHFANIEEDEEVLSRYSCALIGDILLQGYLYITRHYFAFYSNVFGYVTKILIPIITVVDITKEKTARIIPNAIGIATREEKHVFGSLISRDNTLEYIRHIWEKAKSESPPILECEIEDSSEFEEAENGVELPQPDEHNDTRKLSTGLIKRTSRFKRTSRHHILLSSITLLLILLYVSVSVLLYRIVQINNKYSTTFQDAADKEPSVLYSNILHWQAQLHSKSDGAVYNYLDSNLDQIAKVKQALEALTSLLVDKHNPLVEDSSPTSPEMMKTVG